MEKKEITNEDLAVMMKKGFDGMDGRFDSMDQRTANMDQKMAKLETGQEDIKLRLDQAAYRFELNALDKRVTVLENRAGIGSTEKAKVK